MSWCPNVQHALSLISLSIHLFPIFENDPYHLKCFILVLVLLSCVKKVHTINFDFDFELRLFSEISWIFDNKKKKKKKKKEKEEIGYSNTLIVSFMLGGDIENQSKS